MPKPVKPFFAVSSHSTELINKVSAKISQLLGEPDIISSMYDFSSFTTYYEKDMGKNLKKQFLCFPKLIGPEDLIQLKTIAIDLEKESSSPVVKRAINIDPGYIDLSKVVLASHKDASYRIYVGTFTFAQITLLFNKGTFRTLDHVYSDYKSESTIHFFNTARTVYHAQLNRNNVEVVHPKGL